MWPPVFPVGSAALAQRRLRPASAALCLIKVRALPERWRPSDAARTTQAERPGPLKSLLRSLAGSLAADLRDVTYQRCNLHPNFMVALCMPLAQAPMQAVGITILHSKWQEGL